MATIFRSTSRVFPAFWRTQKSKKASTFAELYKAEEEHAAKTTSLWKNISLFGAIPAVLFIAYRAYKTELDHAKHIEEHGRPEFIPYTHLRIRAKPFPWGDGNHSLIHNPHTNALPEGYEH